MQHKKPIALLLVMMMLFVSFAGTWAPETEVEVNDLNLRNYFYDQMDWKNRPEPITVGDIT